MEDKKVLEFINENHNKSYKEFVKTQKRKNKIETFKIITGVDIVLERINERYPKDKYSSYSYGLWRIKELEEEEYQKKKRRGNAGRKLVFFT